MNSINEEEYKKKEIENLIEVDDPLAQEINEIINNIKNNKRHHIKIS